MAPEPLRFSLVGVLPALLTNETKPVALPPDWGANVTVKGRLCPAASVTGNEIPLTENPGPFQLALETVTLFELALSVPVMFLLLPTFTVPKFRVVGLTANVPELVPVPDRATDRLGLFALLVTVTLPLSVPVAGGVKLTLTVTLCPADRFMGRAGPLTLKPVPEAARFEICTVVVWLLLSVRDSVLVLLTSTLPKLRLVGLAPSCPETVPVPESGIEILGFAALLVTDTLPLSDPLAGGVKFTFTVTLCPADRLMGSVKPLTLNPVPEAARFETCTDVVWLFCRVRGSVLVLLTCTLPKFMLVGLAASCPWVAPLPSPERETEALP